jgi:hypothetical protein
MNFGSLLKQNEPMGLKFFSRTAGLAYQSVVERTAEYVGDIGLLALSPDRQAFQGTEACPVKIILFSYS